MPPSHFQHQDETTLQRTTTKDTFERIYSQYAAKIYRKCQLMTNDDELAKDFTQEIFIKVFTKLETFQNRSSVSTWLYAIAHNYCIDQIRLNKRFAKESLSDSIIGQVTEPDTEVGVLQWNTLEQVMKKLPPQEAMLLRMKHEHGLSIKDISDQYQISESAIKMRLKRTRDKVQDLCNVY
jgi:RNA polymerase sigma-70 factor (ECF subfamily)